MSTLTETPKPAPRLLTPKQFYERSGGAIGFNSVYELMHAKRLKAVRLGRKWLIPESELEDFARREADL